MDQQAFNFNERGQHETSMCKSYSTVRSLKDTYFLIDERTICIYIISYSLLDNSLFRHDDKLDFPNTSVKL